jgi:elongator complex protein 3
MSAEVCRTILEEISRRNVAGRGEIARLKLEVCRRLGAARVPANSEILAVAGPEERERLTELLRLKPVRSASGVTVITVMPRPFPCPKPEPCIYCPGGPAFGTPQSYTGREPASARAAQHGYDPRLQVRSRMKQLREIGHRVDKVELIIFGGTITACPRDYIEWFVKECLCEIAGTDCATVEEAQRAAEGARVRVSDIAVETRPDFCREGDVDFLLRLGVTRIELGVQTIYEDVYRLVNRGHTVEDVVEATRVARDSGMAVIYHLMPGLPGSDPERDLEMFREVFRNPDFRPDAIKIYPCLVIKGTKLYEMWRAGGFRPMTTEEAVDLLARVKAELPPWVRVQRIQRDIPAQLIAAGVRAGNLRELVRRRMEAEGKRCRCIRCREVGHSAVRPEDVELREERYEASGGLEILLSFEDPGRDVLLAILRLRVPSERAHRPELEGAAVVRELHVYGRLVPVGERPSADGWQHRGLGRALLAEAERIAGEFGLRKVAVLAGVGVREYYQRMGYERSGPYVSKRLG